MAAMSSAVEDLKNEQVPQCLYWNVDQVVNWIDELGFPYYKVLYFEIIDNYLNCAFVTHVWKMFVTCLLQTVHSHFST